MTQYEVERFEEFLSESFSEEIRSREVRLSTEQIEYMKKIYPGATVQEMVDNECGDGKFWFEVKLMNG